MGESERCTPTLATGEPFNSTLAGVSIARTCDSSLRLVTLDAVRPGNNLQLMGYTCEVKMRLIRSVTYTNNATGGGLLTTRVWDRLNRLTTSSSQSYSGLAALATVETPRRRTPPSFRRGSPFDDIGNRDLTGSRASAVSDYTVDQLNQYTQRTVANRLDVLGETERHQIRNPSSLIPDAAAANEYKSAKMCEAVLEFVLTGTDGRLL